MLYVEQPVGTGFTQGTPLQISDEQTVANEFLGFFKTFVDTFKLHGRKTYVTGESYAGKYIPYIADTMLRRNDSTTYGIQGIQIIDPRCVMRRQQGLLEHG